jgi:hypothetical protein
VISLTDSELQPCYAAKMDRSLREHIGLLDQRLRVLHEELKIVLHPDRRASIETEIRIVHLALTHYRTALELEKQVTRTAS